MTIGITGATGHLGRLVVRGLTQKVSPNELVALVRSPDKAKDLGVPVRAFDYDKPETLAPALAGIDTLLLISANEPGKRASQHRNVIDAAKQAGVKHIVYTSLLRADQSPIDLAVEHRATEEAIKTSGIPYTFLRNGWYTENYLGSLGGALANGAVLGSAGNAKISTAARADYADAAVAVLTTPGHEGKTYELAGDTAWTLPDLAAELSRQTGRTIEYRDMPAGDYAKALEGFGLPAPIAASIASWDVDASNGALYDDAHQLSKLIDHPTTPLAESVKQALPKDTEMSFRGA